MFQANFGPSLKMFLIAVFVAGQGYGQGYDQDCISGSRLTTYVGKKPLDIELSKIKPASQRLNNWLELLNRKTSFVVYQDVVKVGVDIGSDSTKSWLKEILKDESAEFRKQVQQSFLFEGENGTSFADLFGIELGYYPGIFEATQGRAFAINQCGKLFILLDDKQTPYLSFVQKKFLIAHEFVHIKEHHFTSELKDIEAHADFHAGFLMYKDGVRKKKEIVDAVKSLYGNDMYGNYNEERWRNVARGFNQAKKNYIKPN